MSDTHPTTVIGKINKTFTPVVMGETDSNIEFRIAEFKRLFYYWLRWRKYWELEDCEKVRNIPTKRGSIFSLPSGDCL